MVSVNSTEVTAIRFGYQRGKSYDHVLVVVDLAGSSVRATLVELDGSELRIRFEADSEQP